MTKPDPQTQSQPLILVPMAEISSTLPEEPPLWAMRSSYARPILAAGGLPVFVPQITNLEQIRSLLERADGLLLAGGADINPDLYRAEPSQSLEAFDRARDRTEQFLIEWAFTQKIPVLAICRGLQIVNVVLDGSLYQDIPSDLNLPTQHRRTPVTYANLAHHGHLIRIEPKSRLAQIVEDDEIWVNSMHHQAIHQLGKNLRVVARSADGVIEAIESELSDQWFIGLQSHPEAMVEHNQWVPRLFQNFIQATKAHSEKVAS